MLKALVNVYNGLSEIYGESFVEYGNSIDYKNNHAAAVNHIPCHVGYNYLVGRVESMVLDMEKAALELSGFFERQRNASGKEEK